MISQVLIQPTSTITEEEAYIQISTYLLKKLTIPQMESIIIMVGKEKVNAKLKCTNRNDDNSVIYLNPLCLSLLKLPEISIKLQAIYDEKHLILGPIVAVMTEVMKSDDGAPFFGTIHSFCEELYEYSQINGGFYFVTNRASLLGSGYYYHQGKWKEDIVPKPNIIYNRIHSRKIEASNTFQHIKKMWKQNEILFFNDRFLSKWEVYSTLIRSDHHKPYLPQTAIYHSKIFEEWMSSDEDVFIKPESGSQGRRIIHVFKKDHHFYVEQTSFSKNNDLSFPSLQDVQFTIEKWIENKRFLIQQSIPLLTIEQKRIDFRFLCHKKGFGKWKVTSAVARMSGEGQFVSNIAQGGTMHRPLKILTMVFKKEQSRHILHLMEELALEVATVVGDEINGLIGELGIDIGVDITGKPWLIEVNSKPSKQSDSTVNQIRPSAKAICQFCTELWKERSRQDDKNGNINFDTS